VELTIDGGPGQICAGLANASPGTRRRITVRPVEPRSFTGRLILRSAPGGPALTLFSSETSTNGYPLAEGFGFDAPKEPVNFWLEGETTSVKPGDATLQLFVEGSNIAGDSRSVTVVSLTGVTTEIPGTPSKSRRLPEAEAGAAVATNPLILLAGAADSAGPVRL